MDNAADPEDVLHWVQRLEAQIGELDVAARQLQYVNQGHHHLQPLQTAKFGRLVAASKPGPATARAVNEGPKASDSPLAAKFVLVVGARGVGSHVIDAFARAGVGRLGIVADGVVTDVDIDEGAFRRKHLGWTRAESAQRAVEMLAPHTRVASVRGRVSADVLEQVCGLLEAGRPDLVILNAAPEQRATARRWCAHTGVALVLEATVSGRRGCVHWGEPDADVISFDCSGPMNAILAGIAVHKAVEALVLGNKPNEDVAWWVDSLRDKIEEKR